MSKKILRLFAGILMFSSIGWPCSVTYSPKPPTPEERIDSADVIVHVRAEGLADEPGRDPHDGSGSQTRVRFTVLEVLNGQLSSKVLTFNGHLEDKDDPNDRPVPYNFVRPGGRHGNCFALGYRSGGEYLLLLKGERDSELTPYWSPLGPTNEQLLSGASDPWLRWVKATIAGK
jgi:hypothetical protein